MNVTLPPDLAAKLEKVTLFRRGKTGPKLNASVARSILEVALEREVAQIEGRPQPGQVFYDAGFDQERQAEPDPPPVKPLEDRLQDLDLLPRRDYGRGAFDLVFKRLWDAYVEYFDSPEAALDSYELELAEAAKRVGHRIENPRGFFISTHPEV